MSSVLLQTLVVKLRGGKEGYVRVLIDTGSQRSYISKFAAQSLGLQSIGQERVIHSLFGGIERGENHSRYLVKMSDVREDFTCSFEALDQAKICSNIPRMKYGEYVRELKDKKIFATDMVNRNVDLLFENSPEEVHVLIGADIAGKLWTGQVRQLACGLSCVSTKLGWTIMGKMISGVGKHEDSLSVLSLSLHIADSKLADLWRLDTLGILDPNENKASAIELQDEARTHFLKTVSRNDDGRYEVALPWILDRAILPSNRKIAEKCLYRTEKKLANANKKDDYLEVFKEWEAKGFIEVVNEGNESEVHYLPHHPVFKENSETTKIRPVFNASAKSANSPSLNDCLTKGPNLIEIIPSVLNRFRKYQVAVSSDIEKAFLQIGVREQDRDYLRFLVCDAENNLTIYRHKRVVFGVTASPFLLAATLNYHLDQVTEDFSDVARILKDSFYVDNSLTSLDTVEEAKRFVEGAQEVMSSGHFNLRCWKSNYAEVINEETIDISEPVQVLGMIWDPTNDTLRVNTEHVRQDIEHLTKRELLSIAQKIFDPIGLSAPFTLTAKIMLQETWVLGCKWDDELPEPMNKDFKKWYKQLHLLSQLQLPRWLNLSKNADEVSLHVFCDASKKAYATCIFVRTVTDTGVTVQLVNARSRVAPIKGLSIPRLELLACLIGARLSATILKDMSLKNISTIFWTDSSTALAWINRGEQQWGTFVRNRVHEIKSLSESSSWRHVPGKLNPADLPSRGCSAEHLLKSRWWEGPTWLLSEESQWPQAEEKPDEELVMSEKRKTVLVLCNEEKKTDWYYKYFSSFKKMVRMVAWMLRFCNRARGLRNETTKELSASEIATAEKKIIRLIQEDAFTGASDESIRCLRPFADEDGILRTKTSIISREDTENFTCPIILPSDHPVVHRLIFEKHKELHSGVTTLMANLREKFWICKTRKTVRQVISKCVKCQRFSAGRIETEPGVPPTDRVRDASIFEVVGIDLAGPLYLRDGRKSWIVLFTCAIYRAVHLELTTSLSTDAFLQALRRFVSRRGKPHVIYSDNGTNFIGAERALVNVDWNVVFASAATQRIRWKFSPPSAAWWGGWWERLVQMVKRILRKNLGRASLDFEELMTILCDCEQLINSRPLTYISEDVRDPTPLCPAMFLHELPQSGVPDLEEIDRKGLTRRAKYLQTIRDALRLRFRNEYLGQLRHPPYKKGKRTCDVQDGDVVLIEEARMQKVNWPLARVIKTIPGKDGVSRVVKLKTESGEFLRPVQRLYRLEIPEEERKDFSAGGSSTVVTRAGRIVRPPDRLSY